MVDRFHAEHRGILGIAKEREGNVERCAVLRHRDILWLMYGVVADQFFAARNAYGFDVLAGYAVLLLECERSGNRDVGGAMACVAFQRGRHRVPHRA